MQDFKFDCEEWDQPSRQPTGRWWKISPGGLYNLPVWEHLFYGLLFFLGDVCKYTEFCNGPRFGSYVFLNKTAGEII